MSNTTFKIYYYECKQTLRLAIPIMVNQVGQVLFGFVDSIMIGRVSALKLAAASFSTSVFFIFLVFGIGITACVSTLVAQAHGAKKTRECGDILKHALIFNGILGFVFSFLLWILSFHLEIFGQSPDVVAEAQSFFSILGWSLWPGLIYQCFRQFAEGLGNTKPAMVMTFAGLVLNIVLNFFFIYGNSFIPAMGLYGAGLATFIVRWLMAGAMILYIVRKPEFESFLPLEWFKNLQSDIFRKLIFLGVPGGFQFLFEVGAFSFAALMAGWVGPHDLAAHQIAINLASMTFMVAVGISIATSIREGYAVGRGDWSEARRIGLSSISAGGLAAICFGVAFICCRNILPRLYVDEPHVLSIASKLLVITGLFQLFDGVQGVCVGALRGLLDVKLPTIITFVAYWLLCMPLAWLFGIRWGHGAVGIWMGLLLGLVFSAIFLTWRFHRVTRSAIEERRKAIPDAEVKI